MSSYKEYPGKLSDEDIIALFASGKYTIDEDEWVICNRHGRPLYTYTGRKGEYTWVRLFDNKKRRAIATHVCVWIVMTRSVVPKGWRVHHDDENVLNNRPDNLFCLHPNDHTKLHRLRSKSLVNAASEEVPF